MVYVFFSSVNTVEVWDAHSEQSSLLWLHWQNQTDAVGWQRGKKKNAPQIPRGFVAFQKTVFMLRCHLPFKIPWFYKFVRLLWRARPLRVGCSAVKCNADALPPCHWPSQLRRRPDKRVKRQTFLRPNSSADPIEMHQQARVTQWMWQDFKQYTTKYSRNATIRKWVRSVVLVV